MTAKNILLSLVVLAGGSAAWADDAPTLQIYLPRSVQAPSAALRLDCVCVLRCRDEELARKASAIDMGRAPWVREEIVFNRNTILSRLAASGIPADRVQFTGADQVAVLPNEKIVDPEILIQAARDFLQKTQPPPPGGAYQLVSQPKEVVLSKSEINPDLHCRLAKDAPQGTIKVQVAIVSGGTELAVGEMLFRLAGPQKRAVALRDIPAGAIVTPENTKVENLPPDQLSAEPYVSPFGLAAIAPLKAGAVVHAAALKQPECAAAVRRNQNVVMKIQTKGLTISAMGVALQDGQPGDVIKVQNVDSNRIVTAKVAADGTVAPIFEEKS